MPLPAKFKFWKPIIKQTVTVVVPSNSQNCGQLQAEIDRLANQNRWDVVKVTQPTMCSKQNGDVVQSSVVNFREKSK